MASQAADVVQLQISRHAAIRHYPVASSSDIRLTSSPQLPLLIEAHMRAGRGRSTMRPTPHRSTELCHALSKHGANVWCIQKASGIASAGSHEAPKSAYPRTTLDADQAIPAPADETSMLIAPQTA